ncbi:hypothetical protein BKA04_000767 [Cryobacterium mesophilum]|uniref:Uncharacterized protein n=1 Tax=Terrimesophilobacter mesophilus TaxID=433647 RepID=A0A4R8VAJ7_9MICO|nr:hypothetical protein [Terrimesophilobacter mesophilus]MBB5632544.1 hypothetical protein [Terrimesophilobacter mesophilus]TFB79366.1 hypothetical protein E3N84_04430 [Terrimesophilobacter mesophilus]
MSDESDAVHALDERRGFTAGGVVDQRASGRENHAERFASAGRGFESTTTDGIGGESIRR